jgi:hypothetical protein
MDSGCPTPLFINGGMNIIKSSWWAGEKTGPFTGGRGENGVWREGAAIGLRWMGLVLRAPKAKRHLSPALSASQQGTGREGEGLRRLVKTKRLEVAWAFGCAGAMDLVDGMDMVDGVDARDQRDLRLRLAWSRRLVVGGCGVERAPERADYRPLKARKGRLRPVEAGYFECVFFCGADGEGRQGAGRGASPRGRQNRSRILGFMQPINRTKPEETALARGKPDFLKNIYFLPFGVCTRPPYRWGACGRPPSTRGSEGTSVGSGKAGKLASLEYGLDGLASQALRVSCPEESFASRKAISPCRLLDGWRRCWCVGHAAQYPGLRGTGALQFGGCQTNAKNGSFL